jgi:hypothetical protein
MMVEYSIDNGKTWFADPKHVVDCYDEDPSKIWYSKLRTFRNYTLFAQLAGVRGSSRRGLEPRGLPDNISEPVELSATAWDLDGHSHSYVSLDEFKKVLKTLPFSFELTGIDPFHTVPYTYAESTYADIVKYCDDYVYKLTVDNILLDNPTPPQCRLVFWFDN